MRWILGLIGALALSASMGCACQQYCSSYCSCDNATDWLGVDCKSWCDLSVQYMTDADCQVLLDAFNAEGGCEIFEWED